MKIIPSVVCYIESDNRFLFIKRNHPPDLGKYVPPGGKIEVGEDPVFSVKREVKEETGLLIRDPKYRGTAIHYGKTEEWIIFVFYSREFDGSLVPGKEGPLFWVNRDDIPLLDVPPGDKYLLEYIFSANIFFATFWYNKMEELTDYQIQVVV